jgi:hypothetical protein
VHSISFAGECPQAIRPDRFVDIPSAGIVLSSNTPVDHYVIASKKPGWAGIVSSQTVYGAYANSASARWMSMAR